MSTTLIHKSDKYSYSSGDIIRIKIRRATISYLDGAKSYISFKAVGCRDVDPLEFFDSFKVIKGGHLLSQSEVLAGVARRDISDDASTEYELELACRLLGEFATDAFPVDNDPIILELVALVPLYSVKYNGCYLNRRSMELRRNRQM